MKIVYTFYQDWMAGMLSTFITYPSTKSLYGNKPIKMIVQEQLNKIYDDLIVHSWIWNVQNHVWTPNGTCNHFT